MPYSSRFAKIGLAVTLYAGILCGSVVIAEEITIDLTIDAAVDLAQKRSGEIKIQQLSLEKSEADVSLARAKRRPIISVQSSGSYISNPPEGITITEGAFGYAPNAQSTVPIAYPDREIVLVEDTENTYITVRTTVTQPIFTSGKLRAAEELSDLGLNLAVADLDETKADVEREVRLTCSAGRLAQETAPILWAIVETSEKIVADRQRSFEEGIITRLNVLEAESQTTGYRSQYGRAVEGLRTARAIVSYYTGLTSEQIRFSSPFATHLPEIDENELIFLTRFHSPERESLALKVERARLGEKIARASRSWKPDVMFSVSLDTTWSGGFESNLIVTIGTELDAFDFGRSASRLLSAELDVNLAETGLDAFDESITLIIRRSIDAVRTAYFTMEHARANVELATEQRRIALVSFENEMITRETMLAADIGLYSAELELLTASFEFDTTFSLLELLSGTTLAENSP